MITDLIVNSIIVGACIGALVACVVVALANYAAYKASE